MAIAYTCDRCGQKVEKSEDAGVLNIRGVDPGSPYTRRPKRKRPRRNPYISLHMDLCAPCTKVLFGALLQLKHQEPSSTILH